MQVVPELRGRRKWASSEPCFGGRTDPCRIWPPEKHLWQKLIKNVTEVQITLEIPVSALKNSFPRWRVGGLQRHRFGFLTLAWTFWCLSAVPGKTFGVKEAKNSIWNQSEESEEFQSAMCSLLPGLDGSQAAVGQEIRGWKTWGRSKARMRRAVETVRSNASHFTEVNRLNAQSMLGIPPHYK